MINLTRTDVITWQNTPPPCLSFPPFNLPSLFFHLIESRHLELLLHALILVEGKDLSRAVDVLPCYSRESSVNVRTVWALLQFHFAEATHFKGHFGVCQTLSTISFKNFSGAVKVSDRALLVEKEVDGGTIILIPGLWLTTGKARFCLCLLCSHLVVVVVAAAADDAVAISP